MTIGLGINAQGMAVGSVAKAPVVANTGWLSFAGVGSFTTVDTSVGGQPWAVLDNCLLEDALFCSSFMVGVGDLTDTLMAQELEGTPVPVGSTVLGVEVRRVELSGGIGVSEESVRLIKGGVIAGDDKSVGGSIPILPLEGVEVIQGGSSDLWGLALTPADVNAADFGWAFVASTTNSLVTASINIMQMRITYSE